MGKSSQQASVIHYDSSIKKKFSWTSYGRWIEKNNMQKKKFMKSKIKCVLHEKSEGKFFLSGEKCKEIEVERKILERTDLKSLIP